MTLDEIKQLRASKGGKKSAFDIVKGALSGPSNEQSSKKTQVKQNQEQAPAQKETTAPSTNFTARQTEPTRQLNSIPSIKSNTDAIKAYEEIPSYNIVERALDSNKAAAYRDKQSKYADYRQAKNQQTYSALQNAGFTDEDLNNLSNVTDFDKYAESTNKLRDLIDSGAITMDDYSAMESDYFDNPNLYQQTQNHKVGNSLTSLLLNPIESTINTASSLGNYATGNAIQGNKTGTDIIRESAQNGMSGVGKFAYGTAMSLGDMATALATGSVLGGASKTNAIVQGLEKSSGVINNAVQRGLNPNQIIAEGIASGVTTAITEGKAVDSILEATSKGITNNIGKTVAKEIANSMITEGLQEGAEDIADTMADILIAKNQSEIIANINGLINQGVDKKTAVATVLIDELKQIGADVLGGAISGGVMGGANIALNNAGNTYIPEQTYNDSVFPNRFDELVQQKQAQEQQVENRNNELLSRFLSEREGLGENVDPYMNQELERRLRTLANSKNADASNTAAMEAQDIIDGMYDKRQLDAENADIDRMIADRQRNAMVDEAQRNKSQAYKVLTDENYLNQLARFQSAMRGLTFEDAKQAILQDAADIYNSEMNFIAQNQIPSINANGDQNGFFTGDNPTFGEYVDNFGEQTEEVQTEEVQPTEDGEIDIESEFDDNAIAALEELAQEYGDVEESGNETSDYLGATEETGNSISDYENEADFFAELEEEVSAMVGEEPTYEENTLEEADTSYKDNGIVGYGRGEIANKSKSLSSIIRTWGSSERTQNLHKNVMRYLNQFMETGNTDYLENARDYAELIDDEYQGTSIKARRGASTPYNSSYINSFGQMAKLLKTAYAKNVFENNEATATAINGLEDGFVGDQNLDMLLDACAGLYFAENNEETRYYTIQQNKAASGLMKRVDAMSDYEKQRYSNAKSDIMALFKTVSEEAKNRQSVDAYEMSPLVPRFEDEGASFGDNVLYAPDDFYDYEEDDDIGELPWTTPGESLGDSDTEVVIPNGKEKISKLGTNTMMFVDPEQTPQDIADEIYTYVSKDEQQTLEVATNRVTENPENWFDRIMNTPDSSFTSEDVDTGMMLEEMLRAQWAESGDENVKANLDLLKMRLRRAATNAGQVTQAWAKWSRTADGAINAAESHKPNPIPGGSEDVKPVVDNARSETERLWQELVDAARDEAELRQMVKDVLDKSIARCTNGKVQRNLLRKNNYNKILSTMIAEIQNDQQLDYSLDLIQQMGANGMNAVSDETERAVRQLYAEAEKFNPNSKQYIDLENQAFAMLASDAGMYMSFGEKLNNWRYFSMLANPKTHIRNIGGNILMHDMVLLKDGISSIVEASVDGVLKATTGKSINRTKSVLNRLSKSDRELVRKAGENAYDVYRLLADGNKYNSPMAGLMKNRDMFKNGVLQNTVGKLIDLNSNILGAEDEKALIWQYKNSLARYLKANGYDASIFNVENEYAELQREKYNLEMYEEENEANKRRHEEVVNRIKEINPLRRELAEAQNYAIEQAKYATFHQDSLVSDKISETTRTFLDSDNIGAKALGMAIEGTLPFKKTPINILKAAMDFSPVGFTKAVFDVKGIKNGSKSASDLIEDMSKGFTGTGLMVLGAILASKGILLGADGEDEGDQKYAVKVGNGSYTIDTFAPSTLPLLIGASLYEGLDNKNDAELSAFLNALTTVGDPLVETTMLQGLSKILTSNSSSDGESSPIINAATTALLNLATQFIPSELGNIARTVDDTRRTTYTGEIGTLENIVEKTKRSSMSRIPGLSDDLQPYVNKWGEEQEQEDFDLGALGRGLYNHLSPGYYKENDTTFLDRKLAEIGTENSGVSTKISYTTTEGNNKSVKLTPEQLTHYAKKAGQLKREMLTTMFNNSDFRELSTSDKKELADDVMRAANYIAQSTLFSNYSSGNSIYKDYKADGAKAAVDNAVKNALYNSYGFTDKAGTTKGTALIPYLDDTKMSKAEKGEYLAAKAGSIKAAEYFEDEGDYEAVYESYLIRANADASGDGNGNPSKTEIKNYINANYGAEDIEKYMTAFGY